jgi:hypothetical protein
MSQSVSKKALIVTIFLSLFGLTLEKTEKHQENEVNDEESN